MEERIRHMEMIQGIINRLSTNSFLLKGWSVILVSALFALAAKDATEEFALLAYFPVLAFWALDAYFLRQERLYRKLYDRVRLLKPEDIDFSMDVSGLDDQVDSWFQTVISKTLLPFHGVLALAILFVMALISE